MGQIWTRCYPQPCDLTSFTRRYKGHNEELTANWCSYYASTIKICFMLWLFQDKDHRTRKTLCQLACRDQDRSHFHVWLSIQMYATGDHYWSNSLTLRQHFQSFNEDRQSSFGFDLVWLWRGKKLRFNDASERLHEVDKKISPWARVPLEFQNRWKLPDYQRKT